MNLEPQLPSQLSGVKFIQVRTDFSCGALVWDLGRVHWYFMFTPTAVFCMFQRGAAYSNTAATRKCSFFFLSRHGLVFFVFSFLHETNCLKTL